MTSTVAKESVLEAFASDQRMAEKGTEICQDLIDKKYDFSSFVESLGFALASQEVGLRVNGTKLLSVTLAKLPTAYLNGDQLDYVVVFYCDRLKDHHNVIPAVIDAFTSLVRMEHLKEGSVTKIVTHFFQHVSCQSQNRDDREKIYNLLWRISEANTKELIAMGTNYIYNVINAIDGERDPRNLVLLFDFMPKFVQLFPLQHLSEEMFETFACYFPVDFHPMKNDPRSITRDNLAEKLSQCLVACSEFAEWAIRLALEKVESDLIVAKLDSLALLAKCAETFNTDIIDQHFDEIWKHLKPELLPGSGNNEILTAALSTLNAILRNAEKNTNSSKNILTKVLSNVIPYVSNPSHHLFASAFHIAEICVRNSEMFAAEKLLGALSIKLKADESSLSDRTKLLSMASNILGVCSTKDTFIALDSSMLEPIQNSLLEALKTSDADISAQALNIVEKAPKLFNAKQRNEMYRDLLNIFTCDDAKPKDLSRIISQYATMYPDEIGSQLIEPLYVDFGKLSITGKNKVYSNFVLLSKIPRFEENILDMLTKQIFESGNEAEVTTALSALRKLLQSGIDSALVKRLWFKYNVMDNFIRLARTTEFTKDTLLLISSVISLLISQLSVEEQQIIVDKYMADTYTDSASDVFVTQGILGHVNAKVTIGSYFQKLTGDLVKICLHVEDDVVRQVGNTLLCSLMNRIEATEESHATIKHLMNTLREEMKKGRRDAVVVLAWIGKGLSVAGFDEASEIVEDISELLNHPTLKTAAELAFDIISVEIPELHLPIVKFLYKQKLFHTVLNKLWEKLANYEESHVNAFASILGMAPHPIVKMYLDKIGPIIFKCIESNKVKTVQIGLEVVKRFLQEQNEYFRSHFNHLIPQLMKNSIRPDSMAVRIGALECLEIICKYPIFSLQPYTIDVILGLAACLDDKKRLVRNTAVKTRNAWCLLGIDKSDSNK